MSLLALKFGGTSVGSPERLRAVAARIAEVRAGGGHVVAVVSAMGDETDRLMALAEEVGPQARGGPEVDALLACGEQASAALLCLALGELGVAARSYAGWQLPLITEGAHGRALIRSIDARPLREDLASGRVPVVCGFQGLSADGRITTFGRGGSDTTAVALAAVLGADECQIYTDVAGVFTTDPRIVPEARRIDSLTCEEMLELASQGAVVLHARSVHFAARYNVPLRVLSSFDRGEGTRIISHVGERLVADGAGESLASGNGSGCVKRSGEPLESMEVTGIAFARDEAQLKILGVPDIPGAAALALRSISEADIGIDVIVQNTAEDGTTALTFTVARPDAERAEQLLRGAARKLGAGQVTCDLDIAKVSLVGLGMRSQAGVASRMFQALADESINIKLISTSEIKIAVVLDEKYLELAVRSLHRAFNLGETSQRAAGDAEKTSAG